MILDIHPSWKEVLEPETKKPYLENLGKFLREEYSKGTCYPPGSKIFRAFDLCPFDKVRVVILGQDPYIGPNQANGLAFSVPRDVPAPRSLQNIFKELSADLRMPVPKHGDLTAWAEQGVLLLNCVLTVRQGLSASHAGQGWERFTTTALRAVEAEKRGIVFMLWGRHAQKKAKYIDDDDHLVLEAAHPCPMSAHKGFFGCKHFSKANEYLEVPIDWKI